MGDTVDVPTVADMLTVYADNAIDLGVDLLRRYFEPLPSAA
jgi:hypothetical protein